MILFGSRHALYRVSASGGTPARVLGAPDSPISYRWPQFLPDARRYLVFQFNQASPSETGVYAGSLDSASTKLVLTTDYMARYSAQGYLLYVANGALTAERFDIDALQRVGNPFTLAGTGPGRRTCHLPQRELLGVWRPRASVQQWIGSGTTHMGRPYG